MEQNNEKKFSVKSLVAPDVEARKQIRIKINDYAYFAVIGLISILVVFVPPLFSGCLQSDIGIAFPKTVEGWVLWGILNGSTALANVCLLVLFKLQAKKSARNHPNFIKANEIMNNLAGQKEVFIPRSPLRMNMTDYTKKVVCIVLATLLSSITLTSLILSFDWLTLLSCLVSIIITLCVSWITMVNNEIYWTEEYLLYAQMMQEKIAKQQEEQEKLEQESVEEEVQEAVEEPVQETPTEEVVIPQEAKEC